METPAAPVRTCPRCGLTETQLRREGLLGCTLCYETFADLAAQAVEALHGVTVSSAPESAPTQTVALPVAVVSPPPADTPSRRNPFAWPARQPRPSPVPPPKTKRRPTG
ncbi:MAG: hypothetical protein H7Z41_12510 [Cytophagales bacterium]|nr:hypothetical protein [Armatimonadota bacterium]